MTIYVGNLSFQMKDDDLKNTFSEFGNVTSAKVISDKYSGRSKGFGFVEMDNDDAGKAAIEALNGKEVQGRPLRVNEARPKEDNRER
jgi:RNA recognition motif-containing protein